MFGSVMNRAFYRGPGKYKSAFYMALHLLSLEQSRGDFDRYKLNF